MRQWVIAVVLTCCSARTFAGLLLYEPFNYAPGQVLADQVAPNGQTWATMSANVNDDDIAVLDGSLSHAGFPASQGNSVIYGGTGKTERLAVGNSPVTSGSIYYSLLFEVFAPAPATPIFVAGFNNLTGPQASQPQTIGARLYIQAGDADGFQIGVSKNSSKIADVALDGANHPFEQTLLVVGKYEIMDDTQTGTDDIAQIWLDPDPATFGAASAPEATLTAPLIGPDLGVAHFPTVASFILRQGIAALPSVQVDELRIGTSWADVTSSAPQPIPLPPAAFAALACLSMLTMGNSLRRLRRRAA